MDPMRLAIKNRRQRGMDMGQFLGDAALEQPKDEKGDLAPEVKGDEGEADPEGLDLQADMKTMEMENPEHEPLPRSSVMNEMGHEQVAPMEKDDSELEAMMMDGHEHDDMARPARTLGAKIRQSLQKKKGM